MPAVNYAVQYAQALAQAYPNVLHFGALRSTENDSRYRWVNANTIEIPSISTTGRVDGDRDTISTAKRNHSNAWESKQLTNHRKWSTLEHPMNIDETNQVLSIQNITKVFNEEQKFPEMDAYLVSKIYADWVAAKKTADTTALTVDNILSVFDSMMDTMDEARVPLNGRILYTTSAVKKLLKNAKEMSRFIQNGESAINRAVRSLDEVITDADISNVLSGNASKVYTNYLGKTNLPFFYEQYIKKIFVDEETLQNKIDEALGTSSGSATLKSKYYANDWENGLIGFDLTGADTFFGFFEPLPDNAFVYDFSVEFNGKTYMSSELYSESLISNTSTLNVFGKPEFNSDYGIYLAARTGNDSEGTLYGDISADMGTVTGFTLYYLEV